MRTFRKLGILGVSIAPFLFSCTADPGMSGLDGIPGASGPPGVDGAPGAPGANGVDGADGSPGPKGTDGRDGADGADGAPPVDVRGVVTHEIRVGGAEMLTVSADGRYALVVGGKHATVLEIGRARLTEVSTLELPPENYPEGSTDGELTGVAIHPSGAYALLAVRDVSHDPANWGEVRGKLLAVNFPELAVIGEIQVGVGPDSVAVAPNGEFAVVANEDEGDETDLTNTTDNRPGSISFVDLRNGPENLSQVEVPIPPEGIPFFSHDPQPETVKIAPDGSFVLATLQENNAIARVEVPSPLPSPLAASAFSVTNFDAGVRTGFGLVSGSVGGSACRSSAYDLSLREEFTSAREPDGIALTPDGRYFVTADEDNLTFVNDQSFEGRALSQHGSRSISVYDAHTGELVGDSGDSIEQAVIALGLPQRCGSKGPEPEVVDVGVVAGRTLAFVALERSDAISIHDITDPTRIRLLDVVVLNPALVAADTAAEYEPEGIALVPERNLVVVSNPASKSVSLIELRLDSAIHGGGFVPGVDEPSLDCSNAPTVWPKVVINEIRSTPNPDFVELYNTTDGDVDLSSWKLIDDGVIEDAFVFPAGTILPANGFLVVEGEGSPESTPLELPFGLGGSDQVRLYGPCGDLIDSHSWTSHVNTARRCPDGGTWNEQNAGSDTAGTKGASNEGDCP